MLILECSQGCYPVKIIFENCGLNMQYINAPHIILDIINPLDQDNTKDQVLLILKYYLYKCRCLGDKPNINDGLKYLKCCIKIEKKHKFPVLYTKRIYM